MRAEQGGRTRKKSSSSISPLYLHSIKLLLLIHYQDIHMVFFDAMLNVYPKVHDLLLLHLNEFPMVIIMISPMIYHRNPFIFMHLLL